MSEATPLHGYTKPAAPAEPVVTTKVYGYARVSTLGQTLETQIENLTAAGINKIFSEKVSGVKQRHELERMLAKLKPGDLVIVCKLDRLARSTLDLLGVIDRISKAGAHFKSLGDSWADTTTPHGRLMLTVLAGIAEFERELIISRCAEGRARAKAQGKRVGGRDFKLTPHQQAEALKMLDAGEGLRQVARIFDYDFTALSRLRAKAKAAKEQSNVVGA